MHLLVEWLIDHCSVPQLDLGILDIRLVKEGQSVLHPIDVVAIGEILLRMRPTRFLPGLCRMDLLHRLVEQILQFERLNEVGVPDHAAVCDANVAVLFQNAINDVLAFR